MSEKRSWTPMELRYVGNVSEILKGGTGKLSPTAGDSGDARKPPGGGF
jgi:hypothetical protein